MSSGNTPPWSHGQIRGSGVLEVWSKGREDDVNGRVGTETSTVIQSSLEEEEENQ